MTVCETVVDAGLCQSVDDPRICVSVSWKSCYVVARLMYEY